MVRKIKLDTDIGKIEQLFEWNVPLSDLGKDYVDLCYTSPHFRLSDSSWYMTLGTQLEGWIGLYLIMVDSESPITIKYALGVNTTGGDKTFTKTHIFKRSDTSSGEAKLLKFSEMKGLSQLRITCRINSYTTGSLQETPNIVSYVNQAEISDISSRSIQEEFPDSGSEKEDSGDKDWSLLDKKEIPDVISCATQTEIPDIETLEENCNSLHDTEVIEHLRQEMENLLKCGNDHDVTFYVQGQIFRAHRNILKARSSVFRMMFDNIESSIGVFRIEDCDPESFYQFLLFLYCGKTESFSNRIALVLYYTAVKYDVFYLKKRCVSYLKKHLDKTSISNVIWLADRYLENDLLEASIQFFVKNMKDILSTNTWQYFMLLNPVLANDMYIKGVEIISRK